MPDALDEALARPISQKPTTRDALDTALAAPADDELDKALKVPVRPEGGVPVLRELYKPSASMEETAERQAEKVTETLSQAHPGVPSWLAAAAGQAAAVPSRAASIMTNPTQAAMMAFPWARTGRLAGELVPPLAVGGRYLAEVASKDIFGRPTPAVARPVAATEFKPVTVEPTPRVSAAAKAVRSELDAAARRTPEVTPPTEEELLARARTAYPPPEELARGIPPSFTQRTGPIRPKSTGQLLSATEIANRDAAAMAEMEARYRALAEPKPKPQPIPTWQQAGLRAARETPEPVQIERVPGETPAQAQAGVRAALFGGPGAQGPAILNAAPETSAALPWETRVPAAAGELPAASRIAIQGDSVGKGKAAFWQAADRASAMEAPVRLEGATQAQADWMRKQGERQGGRVEVEPAGEGRFNVTFHSPAELVHTPEAQAARAREFTTLAEQGEPEKMPTTPDLTLKPGEPGSIRPEGTVIADRWVKGMQRALDHPETLKPPPLFAAADEPAVTMKEMGMGDMYRATERAAAEVENRTADFEKRWVEVRGKAGAYEGTPESALVYRLADGSATDAERLAATPAQIEAARVAQEINDQFASYEGIPEGMRITHHMSQIHRRWGAAWPQTVDRMTQEGLVIPSHLRPRLLNEGYIEDADLAMRTMISSGVRYREMEPVVRMWKATLDHINELGGYYGRLNTPEGALESEKYRAMYAYLAPMWDTLRGASKPSEVAVGRFAKVFMPVLEGGAKAMMRFIPQSQRWRMQNYIEYLQQAQAGNIPVNVVGRKALGGFKTQQSVNRFALNPSSLYHHGIGKATYMASVLRADLPAGVDGMVRSFTPGTPEYTDWMTSPYQAWTSPRSQVLAGDPSQSIASRLATKALAPFRYLEDGPMTRTTYFGAKARAAKAGLTGGAAEDMVSDVMNTALMNPMMIARPRPIRGQVGSILMQGAQQIYRGHLRMARGAWDIGKTGVEAARALPEGPAASYEAGREVFANSEQAKALAAMISLWGVTEGLDEATGAVPDSLKKIYMPFYFDKTKGAWQLGMGLGAYATSLPWFAYQQYKNVAGQGRSAVGAAEKIAEAVAPFPVHAAQSGIRWLQGQEGPAAPETPTEYRY